MTLDEIDLNDLDAWQRGGCPHETFALLRREAPVFRQREKDGPESPGALPMPLQFMATANAVARINRNAANPKTRARELVGMPVGQIVGRMKQVRPAHEVIFQIIDEFVDAVQRLDGTLAAAEEKK